MRALRTNHIAGKFAGRLTLCCSVRDIKKLNYPYGLFALITPFRGSYEATKIPRVIDELYNSCMAVIEQTIFFQGL